MHAARARTLAFARAFASARALPLHSSHWCCSTWLAGGLSWGLATSPRGASLHPDVKPVRTAKYGSVGFVPIVGGVHMPALVTGGLNEVGLSCDEQTLITTEMPPATNKSTDVNVEYFCQWALSTYASVDEVRSALLGGAAHIWGGRINNGANGIHHSLRDASGKGLVVEYVGKAMQVYEDHNDGKDGFGVLTNEPEYPWMVRSVQHYLWKRGLARPAATMPGAWYPDERFLRLHLVKSGMPKPKSAEEALVQV